jgi:hypothetical protein
MSAGAAVGNGTDPLLPFAQGIPRAAMSPAAFGGRTVEPVAEEDF